MPRLGYLENRSYIYPNKFSSRVCSFYLREDKIVINSNYLLYIGALYICKEVLENLQGKTNTKGLT